MPPANWLAGWVQLWFSIAITKTVLISSALALMQPNVVNRASTPRIPRRLTCDIHASKFEIGGTRWAAFQHHSSERTLRPNNGIAALPPRRMNGRLLFDECVFTIRDKRALQMNTLREEAAHPGTCLYASYPCGA